MIQPATLTVPNTLEQDFRRVDQQINQLSITWNCRRITCCAVSCLTCPLAWTVFSVLDCVSCLLDSTVSPEDRGEPCLMTRGACRDCLIYEEPALPNSSQDVCWQVLNPDSSLLRLPPLHYSTAPERQTMDDLQKEKRNLTLQTHLQSPPALSSIILDYEV